MSNSPSVNESAIQIIKLLQPVVDEFLTCLTKESQFIASGTSDELISVTQDKQHIAERLEQKSLQANQLLAKNALTLEQLFAQFESQHSSTAEALQNLKSLLNQCFDLNQANGIAIQTLSNINRHTLNILTGNNSKVTLYGAKGTTDNSLKESGTKLGKA